MPFEQGNVFAKTAVMLPQEQLGGLPVGKCFQSTNQANLWPLHKGTRGLRFAHYRSVNVCLFLTEPEVVEPEKVCNRREDLGVLFKSIPLQRGVL